MLAHFVVREQQGIREVFAGGSQGGGGKLKKKQDVGFHRVMRAVRVIVQPSVELDCDWLHTAPLFCGGTAAADKLLEKHGFSHV